MTEKRFKLYEHKDKDYIFDNPNEYLDFIEMLGDALTSEEIVDLLNEQHETIQQLQQAYTDAKSDVERYEQILKDIMEDNLLIQDMKKRS